LLDKSHKVVRYLLRQFESMNTLQPADPSPY
jgi:hypothetical protein